MNIRQLIFGVVSGIAIAVFAGLAAYEQLISWALPLVGVGLICVNLLAWSLSQRQKTLARLELPQRTMAQGQA